MSTLLLRGKTLCRFIVTEVLYYGVLFVLSYIGFLKIAEIPGEAMFYLDVWQSIVIGGACLGTVVRLQVRTYEKELVRNEEQRIHMEVLKVETVRPWRVGSFVKGARHVLEVAEGVASSVHQGDVIMFKEVDA